MRLWSKLRERLTLQQQPTLEVQMQLLDALVETFVQRADPGVASIITRLRAWRHTAAKRQPLDRRDGQALLREAEVLGALGEIAAAFKWQVVRDNAATILRLVAAERRLSAAQLGDHVVPACGLDDPTSFAYGARTFTLVLGANHAPLLRSGARMHTSLPHPRPSDDATLIARTAALWRTQKPQLRHHSQAQSRRLEQAMVEGRRWSVGEYQSAIVGHPLLRELARRVIWAGESADGARRDPFCLADDLSFVGEAYHSLDPSQYATVHIPHPANYQPERRQRWADLLADFHVVPLFPQAARPVYGFDSAEVQRTEFSRFSAAPLKWGQLSRPLLQAGWMFAAEQQDQSSYAFRPFSDGALVAVILLSVRQHAQHVERGWFVQGRIGNPNALPGMPPVALANVDPVVASEVLCDLTSLTNNPALLETP